MGDNPVGRGLGGFVDDFTGEKGRREEAKARDTQEVAKSQASSSFNQGQGMVGSAADYWNKWMTDPGAQYKVTQDQASGVGGAMAGQATNAAVNAARGSGLNAGQAALAGGAQSANAFTQGTLGAQQQMLSQGQQSAMGSANTGGSLMGKGMDTNVGIAGQEQDKAISDVTRNDKLITGITDMAKDPFGMNKEGNQDAAKKGAQMAAGMPPV
jgi:hypothetical protein